MLRLTGAELLERFEIIGEDGGRCRSTSCRTAARSLTGAPQEGVLGYRLLPSRRRALVGRALDAAPDAGRRGPARRSTSSTTSRRSGARRSGSTSSARRARCSRPRSTTRRRSPISPSCSCRASPTTASSTRSTRAGRLRQVVISHRDPEREELLREVRRRYPPEQNEAHPVSRGAAGAASRTWSRTRARRRSPARRSTRSTSRSTAHSKRPRTSSSRSRRAGACSGRSRSARASRDGASARSTSSSRTRSRAARRSRSTTRSSSAPRSSRTHSSTRCSSRRRSGSASGTASSASSA